MSRASVNVLFTQLYGRFTLRKAKLYASKAKLYASKAKLYARYCYEVWGEALLKFELAVKTV